jgi:hypothetical protein
MVWCGLGGMGVVCFGGASQVGASVGLRQGHF